MGAFLRQKALFLSIFSEFLLRFLDKNNVFFEVLCW